MSSPTDNTTTPTQTQNALECHIDYHKGCAAWEAYYNASLTSSSMVPTSTTTMPLASITSGADSTKSSSSNIGPIVGGAIGGVVVLIIILGVLFLIYRNMQNKHEQVLTNRISTYNPNDGGPPGMLDASKYAVSSASPAPPSVTTNARTPPPSAGGTTQYQHSPHILDPNFNPYAVPTLASNTYSTNNNSNPYLSMADRQILMTTGGGMTPAPMYQPSEQPAPRSHSSVRDSIATSSGWESSNVPIIGAPQRQMTVQNQAYGGQTSPGALPNPYPHPLPPVPPPGAMVPPPPHSPTPMGAPIRPQPLFPNEKSGF